MNVRVIKKSGWDKNRGLIGLQETHILCMPKLFLASLKHNRSKSLFMCRILFPFANKLCTSITFKGFAFVLIFFKQCNFLYTISFHCEHTMNMEELHYAFKVVNRH